MQILDLESAAMLEVAVHEVDASEEGFLAHFIGRKHFNHPVYHL